MLILPEQVRDMPNCLWLGEPVEAFHAPRPEGDGSLDTADHHRGKIESIVMRAQFGASRGVRGDCRPEVSLCVRILTAERSLRPRPC
jgi:hypothetical protein